MGLIVEVFKNPLGDCTLDGISSQATALTIVNVSGPFDPRPERPPAMLVKGNMPGMVKVVPALLGVDGQYAEDKRWTMMGGNYAATSDSRWTEAIRRLTGASFSAVPIHDRIESKGH
jgi:hypothetical protein